MKHPSIKQFPLSLATLTLVAVIAGEHFILRQARAQNPAPVVAAAPPANPPDMSAEIAALKKEIATLQGKVPDQSHVMKDVAYHFTNLWFAAQSQNWPLAKFYFDETRSHLQWAVRVRPIRKIKGGELDMKAMLDGVEMAALTPLQKTIEGKNLTEFSAAYRQTLIGCQGCHAAAEKPYLRLRIPEQPEARIIDFVPATE